MKRFAKYMLFMFMFMVVFFLKNEKVLADSATIENNNDGTVTLKYNNEYDVKVKLVVQLSGGKQYKYDIPKGTLNINIPMTQGNGEYKFILCRNISGTRYAVMQTTSITQSLSSDEEAYLSSNYIISWNSTNNAVKKAAALAKGKSGKAKIKVIYEYVVKNYSYDYDKAKNIDDESKTAAYIPNIDTVMSNGKGICYDISILLASMLRSVDVPTKVVTGYTPNATVYHAWNNVYESSKWNVIDATYDLQMHKAKRKYSMYKSYSDYKDIVYTY